jgi:hypothetical protein
MLRQGAYGSPNELDEGFFTLQEVRIDRAVNVNGVCAHGNGAHLRSAGIDLIHVKREGGNVFAEELHQQKGSE